jgi:hypothetical protein
MTKVVFKPLKTSGRVSVKRKKVRDADGKLTTMFVVDANSPTFADDITYVFRKNVAKARRNNKALLKRAAKG